MDCKFCRYTLTIKGEKRAIVKPWVMGILNVTPDSFYSGSRMGVDEMRIGERVEEILKEGGDIIDIGAYSTRSNADDISPEEEYSRLKIGLNVIKNIDANAIVSVDTFRADVARRCVEEFGVDIVNDVSGGTLDDEMFATVANLKVPYILMHMRGTPATMQQLTEYNDVTRDVIDDLHKKKCALNDLGIDDVIIDPGFGFSKIVEQNFEMLNRLEDFKQLDAPLLVGVSRKSMIYRTLGCTPVESLNGTTVINTISLLKGAHILRVHDVKEAVEVCKLVGSTIGARY
ncbi:MAG: dihydropteroate synthase [Muribaculaceae bacterium]